MKYAELQGCRYVTERDARTRYPGCSETHQNLYPGKLVPVWAERIYQAAWEAGVVDLGKEVNKILARMGDQDAKFELVLAIESVLLAGEPGRGMPVINLLRDKIKPVQLTRLLQVVAGLK